MEPLQRNSIPSPHRGEDSRRGSHTGHAPLQELFIRRCVDGAVNEAVPTRFLSCGDDSIRTIRCAGFSNGSWQVSLSSITSFIATTGPITLQVSTLGFSPRTIELAPFDSVTLWPQTMYSFVGGDGEALALSRSSREAASLAAQWGMPDIRPTSGFLISPASTAGRAGDGQWLALPAEASPGFELRRISGFDSNESHYHQTFSEAYHVVKGHMLVKLSLLSGESYEGRVEAGDSVVIPRNTVHHVLGGSPDNQVLVSYWPRFFGDTDKVLA